MPCRVQPTRPVGLFLRVGTLTHGGMAIQALTLTNHRRLKMKKLILKQDGHATAPYKIVEIHNSISHDVGQRLTRDEVKVIVNQRVRPYDVRIK